MSFIGEIIDRLNPAIRNSSQVRLAMQEGATFPKAVKAMRNSEKIMKRGWEIVSQQPEFDQLPAKEQLLQAIRASVNLQSQP